MSCFFFFLGEFVGFGTYRTVNATVLLTRIGPQSRFGDKLLKI